MRNAETLDALLALFVERGFADLSVHDMAKLSKRSKSTLYGVASSKDGIIEAVVKEFFRRATEQVERCAADGAPGERLGSYLSAISSALAPVGPQFFADLDRLQATREIYHANIRMASQRVQQLALAALPKRSPVDPRFVGALAGVVIEAIHRGQFQSTAGLAAADAYSALAALLSAGIRNPDLPVTESETQ